MQFIIFHFLICPYVYPWFAFKNAEGYNNTNESLANIDLLVLNYDLSFNKSERLSGDALNQPIFD